MADSDLDLSLSARSGLPEDLRVLVARYPREGWQSHANLGETAKFWLKRHDMFRELGATLGQSLGDYREGRQEAQPFAQFFVPRLRFFLQQLHGHHHIEDEHYFPVFRQAESRLVRGFDLLDADHHVIHEALEAHAHSANAFLSLLGEGRDAARRAADAHGDHSERLITMLTRHLADEEDLIVPVILDRGEDTLGLH